ncbi:MAG: peptidoglycan bridge formation glycyltransferase FemA/FemB family protein [Candidatus Spechtbacterales bacterium]
MNIREINNKELWDSFVTSRPDHTFLHSFAWGEFNDAMGERVWRFGAFSPPYEGGEGACLPAGRGGSLVAVALVIKVHARRGNFLFVPHGTIFAESEEILNQFVKKFKEIARIEKVSFIRISPLLKDTDENKNLFKQFGFRPAPIHMHAETTWTLDLNSNEEKLLMGTRKTTRNLIRRAIGDGVEIKTGTSDADVDIFYDLYKETVKKHNFTPFSLTFIKKQVRIFSESANAQIFTAWYDGKAIASAIIIFYGNSAFYHHGASIPSKIPAAYLLQWEAIREAKRRGHKFYNFWGIVREDAPASHPWQGITLFKKGFGGFQTNYLHAQDLPLSWRYWPNYIFETLRRMRRRL